MKKKQISVFAKNKHIFVAPFKHSMMIFKESHLRLALYDLVCAKWDSAS